MTKKKNVPLAPRPEPEVDGWKKNEAKYKADFVALKNRTDGKVSDWLKAPWDMHHYIDMFVESARAAPYLMGHVWGVYVPLSLAAIGGLVWAYVR